MRYVAVLDTETTGIPDLHPLARIVEVAAVVMDEEGRIRDTWQSLCNPGELFLRGKAAEEALAINGVSLALLKHRQSSWQAGKALQLWLVQHLVSVVTSYHTEFDFHPLLLGAPEWLAPIMPPLQLGPCVHQWARKHLHHTPERLTLTRAMEALVLPRNGRPHTALADALDAASIIQTLLNQPGELGATCHRELFGPRDPHAAWAAVHSTSEGRMGTTL